MMTKLSEVYVKDALHVKEAFNRVNYWVADVGHINQVLNLCFTVPQKKKVQGHRGKKKRILQGLKNKNKYRAAENSCNTPSPIKNLTVHP